MADENKDKGSHEFDVEVFAVGKWNGDDYTDADLTDMVRNFEALGDTVKPPVKLGHNEKQLKDILQDGQPALGWVKSLRKSGGKLIATLTQVPDIVFKAIKGGLYKRVSSEIYWNYKQGGKVFKRVFAGLALLGADIPAVSTLKDLEAFLSQSMQDHASFDRIAVHAFAADESGTKILEREEHIMDEKELKIYQEKVSALEAKVAALEPDAAQAKKYQAELEAIKKTQAEGRKTAQQAQLKEFCEQMVKDGKLPPACVTILTDFGKLNYSDDAGYSLSVDTVIEALKTFEKVILSKDETAKDKKGGGQADYTDVHDELDQKTRKHMAENKMKPEEYGAAVKAVFATDKDLAERYLAGSPE